MEPLTQAVGLLDRFSATGRRIDVQLSCDLELSFTLESDRELSSTKKLLLRSIGKIISIFVDEHGVPHVRDMTSSKERTL